PHVTLHEIIAEIKRLDLVKIDHDSKSKEVYLLQQPVKKQIDNLPKEFMGKPYEYFLDKEYKIAQQESASKWYESANAQKQFEDYPTTKKNANASLVISIITGLIALAALIVSILKKG
ncbi:MAG: hypothetical protein JWR72_145, partial [Flavisolibacter sp.]|nr:hypothetical protein [Flavisolibacter sp.]